MNKIIYSVEYNKREYDGMQIFDRRSIGIEYERECDDSNDNELRKVIKIEESWEYGKKIVTIFYEGGDEDEREDSFAIYRKINLK
jgi:hypothetical protein